MKARVNLLVRAVGWAVVYPANVVSGKPRTPGIRIENSEPDRGAAAKASSFRRTDALVTNRVSRLGPPKQQLVGRGTGILMRNSSTPCGEKRDTRQASQTATHRHPASSTVMPSGVPSFASSVMKGCRLLMVPASRSKS